jgi:hypothetical protein
MKPPRKPDAAQFYYWTMQFIEPANPDDDCYVMLHGDEGEVFGPMTMRLADLWLRHLNSTRKVPFSLLPKSA